MKRKFWGLILTITMMGSLITPIMSTEVLAQTKPEYRLNITPETIGNNSFLPIKLVAKELNTKVEWLQHSKNIVLIKGTQKIHLEPEEYIIKEDGETLISFDVIANKFNYDTRYNAVSKEVRLMPLVPPVAKFKLPGGRYIEKRPIAVINESYSPEGETIVESLWQIEDNNKSIQTNDFNKVVKSLNPGNYNIKLKVKNSKKAWSEWEQQSITIEPRPRPVITSFAAIELEWAQGEMISYNYNTQVETGINIVESRWTYQKEGNLQATVGEPVALFEEGTYTITLEVKDEYNVWSLPATTKVHITDKIEKTELQFKLENGRRGDTLQNHANYNFQNYDVVENFKSERMGPTLLFSNSPETVLNKGILYSDKVVGDTRILYHHRNGIQNSSKNARLVIAVENNGTEPATITQTKKSHAGASDDILHLGQIVTRRYFNSSVNDKIVLKPNEKKYLYDTVRTDWPISESFSGLLEFNTDKMITVTVAAVDKAFQLKDLRSLPVAPRDGVHTRGTFQKADKRYTIPIPADRPSKIMLGQRDDHMDSWISGRDALTGASELNKGNYGVMYQLDMFPDENTGILLNPRGPSFKGAYQWEGSMVTPAPIHGMFKGTQQSSVVGTVNAKNVKRLSYTLSNGSSAPVLITFIPEPFWEDYKIEKNKEN